MRKRDINKQYSPKEREQTYYLDIFEPPPTWRPHSHSNYYPPTHRSPLHHQPSLSEIVYQDYTDNHIVYRRSMLDSSSSLHYQEYDSDFDDSQQEIKTADDMSMFTAAEDVPDEDIIRHGHLPTAQEVEIINNFMKKMDIKCSAEWKDYKSQYCLLNESYDIERKRIYKEIVTALGKIQEVDARVDKVKFEFQAKMDTKYQELHENLIEQCKQVIHEAKEQKAHQLRQANEIKIQLNEKVRLNVGGSIFETSLSTLCRDSKSLLAVMFSGRHELSVESDGSYFIDRDPTHFRLVLNYLRDLRISPVILQDDTVREELLHEARYYCIEGLVNLLLHQA